MTVTTSLPTITHAADIRPCEGQECQCAAVVTIDGLTLCRDCAQRYVRALRDAFREYLEEHRPNGMQER